MLKLWLFHVRSRNKLGRFTESRPVPDWSHRSTHTFLLELRRKTSLTKTPTAVVPSTRANTRCTFANAHSDCRRVPLASLANTGETRLGQHSCPSAAKFTHVFRWVVCGTGRLWDRSSLGLFVSGTGRLWDCLSLGQVVCGTGRLWDRAAVAALALL